MQAFLTKCFFLAKIIAWIWQKLQTFGSIKSELFIKWAIKPQKLTDLQFWQCSREIPYPIFVLQTPFFSRVKQRFALVKLLLVSRRNKLEWSIFSCFIGVKNWTEAKEKGEGAVMSFLWGNLTGQLKWGQPPIVPSTNVFKTCEHVFFPVFLPLFPILRDE